MHTYLYMNIHIDFLGIQRCKAKRSWQL